MIQFGTHWLDLPLGRTRVRTGGTGPALMFTHGLLVDSRIWDRVACAVAEKGFTAVLPDLPLGAHTVAVADRARLTTPSVAGTLFDVADELGIGRFALLGFDTGGAVAQLAAAARPDRIDRRLGCHRRMLCSSPKLEWIGSDVCCRRDQPVEGWPAATLVGSRDFVILGACG